MSGDLRSGVIPMAILQLVRLSNARVVGRKWALVTAGCRMFRSR